MNLKKKMRRGSLAALIALALSSSALAMPTGGEVVRGGSDITLSGGTWDAVANNATITANNDGQINWQTFNILGGETLNFYIANDKTLLNQVTGDQLSSILGTMNQTGSGKGNVVLINPNGIYVGTNAVLNISDLTLSALSAEKATDTERILKAGGEGLVNVTGGHFIGNEVNLIGRKVTVADGVVFDLGTSGDTSTKTMLQVLAADRAEWTFDGDKMLTENITHNTGNDVVFNGTVNVVGDGNQFVSIGGATLTATGAEFHGNHENMLYAASKFSVDEREADHRNHTYVLEASASNVLKADRLKVQVDDFALGGGVIELKNSIIDTRELSFAGVSSWTGKGDGLRNEYTSAPDRTVNIESSTLRAHQGEIFGGKVTVADDVTFKLASHGYSMAEMSITAGNRYLQSIVDHGDSLMQYRGAAGNEVAFHGTVEHEEEDAASFGIDAFSINADRAKLHGNHFTLTALTKSDENHSEAAEGKASVERSAANRVQADGLTVKTKALYIDGGRVDLKNSDLEVDWLGIYADAGNLSYDNRTARPDNVVSLKNVTIRPAYTKIYGGMVTMEGSTIETPTLTEILAGESYSIIRTQHGDQKTVVNVTKDNVIDLRHTTVTAPRVLLGAGKIGVWEGSTIAAGKADGLDVNLAENVTRTDGSAALYQRDAASHVTVNGIESPTFTETSDPVPPVPQPPVNPETPTLSEDDQANIDEGSAKAQIALTEATQGARSEALTKTIAKLNENAATSRRKTTGVLVGVVQAIAESGLTDAEKAELQVAVLDAYAPVQEAKAEQSNLSTNTVNEAVSAATNVSVAPVYPDETEAEETVSFT